MTNLETLIKRLVDKEAAKVHKNPTIDQKEAGNYRKGHIQLHGLSISIENKKGSIRSGISRNGKRWSVKLPDHYGYIKKTKGADGDHLDVYIGPHPLSRKVFVIDQVDHQTKKFDEHKAMLGYDHEKQALDAYHKAFSDGKVGDRIGHISAMTIDEFKHWINTSDTKMPLIKSASKDAISKNIRTEMEIGKKPQRQAVAIALETARRSLKKADGGSASMPWYAKSEARSMSPTPHVGPLLGSTPGRADKINTTVANGSHIIPAMEVAHLGQGNTAAGAKVLDKMFSGPGLHSAKPNFPKLPALPKTIKGFAKGGKTDTVPVCLSDGEYAVKPDIVRKIGDGDQEKGHRILDAFIMNLRKDAIKTLKHLPPPKKD